VSNELDCEVEKIENARMVDVIVDLCRIPGADAVGSSCSGHSDLNVAILQRRVSAPSKR
jgi:hypothetical protein